MATREIKEIKSKMSFVNKMAKRETKFSKEDMQTFVYKIEATGIARKQTTAELIALLCDDNRIAVLEITKSTYGNLLKESLLGGRAGVAVEVNDEAKKKLTETIKTKGPLAGFTVEGYVYNNTEFSMNNGFVIDFDMETETITVECSGFAFAAIQEILLKKGEKK